MRGCLWGAVAWLEGPEGGGVRAWVGRDNRRRWRRRRRSCRAFHAHSIDTQTQHSQNGDFNPSPPGKKPKPTTGDFNPPTTSPPVQKHTPQTFHSHAMIRLINNTTTNDTQTQHPQKKATSTAPPHEKNPKPTQQVTHGACPDLGDGVETFDALRAKSFASL